MKENTDISCTYAGFSQREFSILLFTSSTCQRVSTSSSFPLLNVANLIQRTSFRLAWTKSGWWQSLLQKSIRRGDVQLAGRALSHYIA